MVHPQPFLVFLGFFLLLLRFTANLIFFSPPQVAGSFTQTEQMITWLYWMSVKCLMTQVSRLFRKFFKCGRAFIDAKLFKTFFFHSVVVWRRKGLPNYRNSGREASKVFRWCWYKTRREVDYKGWTNGMLLQLFGLILRLFFQVQSF